MLIQATKQIQVMQVKALGKQ